MTIAELIALGEHPADAARVLARLQATERALIESDELIDPTASAPLGKDME